jgi:hypothetical protein
MRRAAALCLALTPVVAFAQAPGASPLPPFPQTPPSSQMAPGASDSAAGAAQQGYGGCYGCSYSGDYFGSGAGPSAPVRRPAPPLRIQGQWRNGWWYY